MHLVAYRRVTCRNRRVGCAPCSNGFSVQVLYVIRDRDFTEYELLAHFCSAKSLPCTHLCAVGLQLTR